MHQGSFPNPPAPLSAPMSYVRGPHRPGELDPVFSRRQWLLGAGGICLGAGLALGLTSLIGVTAAPAAPGPVPAKGTLDWALAMRDAPADELIRWAGDLERVAATARDSRLVPGFERLLDAVLGRRGAVADQAGACAVRSLLLLGEPERVAARQEPLRERRDLEETLAVASELLERGPR